MNKNVIIWGNEATGLDVIKDYVLSFPEQPTSLDWYFTSDGQHLLLIAVQNRIHIYVEERATSSQSQRLWVTVSTIHIDWAAYQQKLKAAWLENGSILVTGGEMSVVYSKFFIGQGLILFFLC